MRNKNDLKLYLLITITAILLFIPYLGSVHLFDWDELNFAEAAREMVVTGDYFTVRINYEPFHEKPPLFFWLQAISMKIFGVTEFAARLPNALTGIISMLFLFTIGKKLFDRNFGLLWVIAYSGSILPYFYFKTGIIDPVFNLFILVGIYYISEHFFQYIYLKKEAVRRKYRNVIFAGIFICLAIFTKGPVGYLLPALSWFIFWLIKRKEIRFPFKEFIVLTSISFLPVILWYIISFTLSGANILEQFISYQLRLLTTEDASHGGPIYYHFLVLLMGCFPASILMLRGFRRQSEDIVSQKNFKQFMIILLAVVLGIFSLVETKIVHYSSLAYYPITFLAAYTMYSILYRRLNWKKSTAWLIAIFGIFWAAAIFLIPYLLINSDIIAPKISDKFTNAILQKNVGWGGWEWLLGLVYLTGIITSIFMFIKKLFLKGFIYLFGSTAIVMFMFLPLIVPRMESYLQGDAISFYQSMAGHDCYVQPLDIPNYKYGHYFYTEKPKRLSPEFNKNIPKTDYKEWLMTGKIDFPAYFITKNTKAKKYLENPEIKELYSINGFVFLVRMPYISYK